VSPAARWSDERGLVGKAIVLLLVVVVLVGLMAVEAGSIIFTKLSVQNTADAAAADGQRDLASSHSAAEACAAAKASALDEDKNVVFVTCSADPKTGVISIKIRKTAPTLIVRRIGFLRKLGVVKATAQNGPGTGNL
jgi:Flp pilus assembly protein TadG